MLLCWLIQVTGQDSRLKRNIANQQASDVLNTAKAWSEDNLVIQELSFVSFFLNFFQIPLEKFLRIFGVAIRRNIDMEVNRETGETRRRSNNDIFDELSARHVHVNVSEMMYHSYLLPLALHPLSAIEETIFLGDLAFAIFGAVVGESFVHSVVHQHTYLLSAGGKLLNGSFQELSTIIVSVKFVSQSLLHKVQGLLLLSRLKVTAIFSYQFDDQELAGEVLAKELNVLHHPLKGCSLQASMPDTDSITTTPGYPDIKETSPAMKLLLDRDILGASHGREQFKGVDRVRCRVMRTRNDQISKCCLWATCAHIPHPVGMQTDGEINHRDRRNTACKLAAVHRQR